LEVTARAFLGEWRGSLVCNDYQGYDALFREGVTEVGCMAHARRRILAWIPRDDVHCAN